MKCIGSCSCRDVKVIVLAEEEKENLNPRICDCDYCRQYPSSLISHPTMKIYVEHSLSALKVDRNGDELAGFYRCKKCNSLIFVGCLLGDKLRGGVNVELLDNRRDFGEDVNISPKLLKPNEKLERWSKLWGVVYESDA